VGHVTIPNYVMLLSGEKINGENVSCTGRQLLIILNELSGLVEDWVWFAADVSANNALPQVLSPQSAEPFRVGSLSKLKEACAQVDQYFSGIFLAIQSVSEEIVWSDSLSTEDARFRDIHEAILEIRAFDTSYYEVYSVKRSLLEPLATRFGVRVESRRWSKIAAYFGLIIS
jgi:hypothetical protein